MKEGLTLGQLAAFVEVARLGNITKSAENLFLSQSALSIRLKRLEHEVGERLFSRDHRGARLTLAGEAFRPFAEETIHLMDKAVQAARISGGQVPCELTIGATHSVANYLLPPVISKLIHCSDNLQVSVQSAPSEEIVERVLRGEIQLGIARTLQHPAIECSPLYDEEFVLAVVPSHPLAADSPIERAQLNDETIITMFRSVGYRRFIQQLAGDTTPPRRSIDVDNADIVKRMLAELSGVGLLPLSAVLDDFESGALCRLRVTDAGPMTRTMGSLWLRGSCAMNGATRFLELLSDRLDELGLTGGASLDSLSPG